MRLQLSALRRARGKEGECPTELSQRCRLVVGQDEQVDEAEPSAKQLNKICVCSSVGQSGGFLNRVCRGFDSHQAHFLFFKSSKGVKPKGSYLSENVTFSHIFFGRVTKRIFYFLNLARESNPVGSYYLLIRLLFGRG